MGLGERIYPRGHGGCGDRWIGPHSRMLVLEEDRIPQEQAATSVMLHPRGTPAITWCSSRPQPGLPDRGLGRSGLSHSHLVHPNTPPRTSILTWSPSRCSALRAARPFWALPYSPDRDPQATWARRSDGCGTGCTGSRRTRPSTIRAGGGDAGVVLAGYRAEGYARKSSPATSRNTLADAVRRDPALAVTAQRALSHETAAVARSSSSRPGNPGSAAWITS
jgi:hypothetical protein